MHNSRFILFSLLIFFVECQRILLVDEGKATEFATEEKGATINVVVTRPPQYVMAYDTLSNKATTTWYLGSTEISKVGYVNSKVFTNRTFSVLPSGKVDCGEICNTDPSACWQPSRGISHYSLSSCRYFVCETFDIYVNATYEKCSDSQKNLPSAIFPTPSEPIVPGIGDYFFNELTFLYSVPSSIPYDCNTSTSLVVVPKGSSNPLIYSIDDPSLGAKTIDISSFSAGTHDWYIETDFTDSTGPSGIHTSANSFCIMKPQPPAITFPTISSNLHPLMTWSAPSCLSPSCSMEYEIRTNISDQVFLTQDPYISIPFENEANKYVQVNVSSSFKCQTFYSEKAVQTRIFKVCPQISAPTLITEDGVNSPSTLSWNFTSSSWGSCQDMGSFIVYYGQGAIMKVLDTVGPTTFSVSVPSSLTAGGTFIWYVVAVVNDGAYYVSSEARTFTVCKTDPPGKPGIVTPVADSIVRSDLNPNGITVYLNPSTWGTSCSTSEVRKIYASIGNQQYILPEGENSFVYKPATSFSSAKVSLTIYALQSSSVLGTPGNNSQSFFWCTPQKMSNVQSISLTSSQYNDTLLDVVKMVIPSNFDFGECCDVCAKYAIVTIGGKKYAMESTAFANDIAFVSPGSYPWSIEIFNGISSETVQGTLEVGAPPTFSSFSPNYNTNYPSSTTSVTFTWNSPTGTLFNLFLTNSSNFESPEIKETRTTSSYTWERTQLVDQECFCMVCSTDANMKSACTPWIRISFGTFDSSITAPTILTHSGGANFFEEELPLFWLTPNSWGSKLKFALFSLYIYPESTSNTPLPLVNITVAGANRIYSHTLSSLPGVKYIVKICAYNGYAYACSSQTYRVCSSIVIPISPVSKFPLSSNTVNLKWKLVAQCSDMSQNLTVAGNVIPLGMNISSYNYSFAPVNAKVTQTWQVISVRNNVKGATGNSRSVVECSSNCTGILSSTKPSPGSFVGSVVEFGTFMALSCCLEFPLQAQYYLDYQIFDEETGNLSSMIRVKKSYSPYSHTFNQTQKILWKTTMEGTFGTISTPPRILYICHSEPITPPTLIFPEGYAFSSTTTFTWSETSFGIACESTPKMSYIFTLKRGSSVIQTKQFNISTAAIGSIREYQTTIPSYGTYTWGIEKINGVLISKIERQFVYCYLTAPGKPQQTSPSDDISSNTQYPVVLSWTLSDWGSGCSGRVALGDMNVFAGTTSNTDDMRKISVAKQGTNSVQVSLSDGIYYWALRANNGLDGPFSNVRGIKICNPTAPKSPALIQAQKYFKIGSGSIVVFNFVSVTEWGSNCFNTKSKGYKLVFSSSGVKTILQSMVDDTPSVQRNLAFSVDASLLTIGKGIYEIVSINSDGVEASTSFSFTVCKTPDPLTVISPSNHSSNIPIFPIFEWSTATASQIGYPCEKSPSLSILLYYDTNPSPSILKAALNTRAYRFDSSQRDELRLDLNTTYYWMISSYNGEEKAFSAISSFSTVLVSCDGISCGHGECIESVGAISCSCNEGWKGDFCSKSTESSAAAIGASVGSAIFVCAIIAVLLLFYKKRLTKKEAVNFKLPKPNLESLRFIDFEFDKSETKENVPQIDSIWQSTRSSSSLISGAPATESQPTATATPPQEFLERDIKYKFVNSVKLLSSCSAGEMEGLTRALLYGFTQLGHGREFLEALIGFEITCTDEKDVPTLFGQKSSAVYCFHEYCRMVGLRYIWDSYSKMVEKFFQEAKKKDITVKVKGIEMETSTLSTMSSAHNTASDLNVEPAFLDSLSAVQVQIITDNLLSLIYEKSKFPNELKKVLSFTHREFTQNFEEHNAAIPISTLIILKFILAAIVVPGSYRVFPKHHEVTRKELALVYKLVSRIVSGEQFRENEPLFGECNTFIESNHDTLNCFLLDLCSEADSRQSDAHISVPTPILNNAFKVIASSIKEGGSEVDALSASSSRTQSVNSGFTNNFETKDFDAGFV
eukprot:TRINITY_DN28131_c0_g1_i1.p1 TRINITY_DN28131_c0_g1~~TRINITY_DN28131_c0_g1_i1.p1  ORF type:complete len:1963 (+),score=433.93 TRINITY_DN28131_c0_g1_i1:24-5891(+)